MKIERNIPIPSPKNMKQDKYGFVTEMKHGDSVFLKSKDVTDQYATTYFYKLLKNQGLQATIRKQGNGYRIWAIKPKKKK